jgi:hypothetical protein
VNEDGGHGLERDRLAGPGTSQRRNPLGAVDVGLVERLSDDVDAYDGHHPRRAGGDDGLVVGGRLEGERSGAVRLVDHRLQPQLRNEPVDDVGPQTDPLVVSRVDLGDQQRRRSDEQLDRQL